MINLQRGLPKLPPAIERYGMIASHGAVGASVFALLAAGPRVLGPDGYAALALTWTLVTIVSMGLLMPGEQVVTRNVSAGASASALTPVARRMFVLAPLSVLVLPLALDDGVSWDRLALWLASLLVSVVAYVSLAVSRGELAGRGEFSAYSMVLFAEAGGRILVTAAAVAVPSLGAPLLASAVALPMVLAATLARHWARRLHLGAASELPVDTRLEHLSFTAVSAMMQIVLSTAQFWLYRQSPDAAIAGAFVTAVSYVRIPLVLAGGIYAPLLSGASAAFAAGDREGVLRKTGGALALGIGGAAALSAVLVAFSGLGMTILYGPGAGLPLATYVWLGVSNLTWVAALVLTNVLYGCARATAAVVLWIPATVLTTVLYASAGGNPTTMAVGASVGLLFASVCLAVFLYARALPTRRLPD